MMYAILGLIILAAAIVVVKIIWNEVGKSSDLK